MNFLAPISREQFANTIPTSAKLLEVGPYAKPQFRRPDYNVTYADISSIEDIRANAHKYGQIDESLIPDQIDIIIAPEARPTFTTDLKFDCIFSSHNIEHQPDIVNHLKEMAAVAVGQETKFFLAVPDKRYCFDHFQAPSIVTEMIGAHWDGIRRNRYAKFLQTELYRAHNNPFQHWQNDNGPYPYEQDITPEWIAKVKDLMAQADKLKDQYVDTHAWQFTPNSFAHSVQTLYALGLQPWKVLAIFETQFGTNEFFAILEL